MAVYDQYVLHTRKDQDGNKHLLYPITKLDCVDGAEKLLRFDESQKLSDAEKATAMVNLGLPDVAVTGNYADIAEKPFGDLVVFKKTRVIFNAFGDNCNIANFDLLEALVEGESYVVTWDNVEYTCVATDINAFNENLSGSLYLGNTTKWLSTGVGEDTGEPFFIAGGTKDTNNYLSGTAHTDDMQTSHSISIVPKNSIRKIDAAYLPDGIATKEYVQQKISEIEVSGSGSDYVEILPETTAEQAEDDDIFGVNISPAPFALVEGESYTVVYNGVEYTCIAWANDAQNLIGLGNTILLDDVDTGHPFVAITDLEGDSFFALGFIVENGSVTGFNTTGFTIQIYQGSKPGVAAGSVVLPEIAKGDKVEILAEHEADFVNYDSHYVGHFEPTFALDIVAGESYTVVWDSDEFSCVAADAGAITGDATLEGIIVLGNLDMAGIGEDTGEPFLLALYSENEQYYMVEIHTTSSDSTHEIAIYKCSDSPDEGKVLGVVDGAWAMMDVSSAGGELPEVTTDDNGKFLRVVDGAWAAYGGCTEYFEKTDVTFVAAYSDLYGAAFVFALTTGETYTVSFNGVAYQCVAAGDYLGNFSLNNSAAEDTGEPFFLICNGAASGACQYVLMQAPTATENTVVEISQGDTQVFRADEWFAAEGMFGTAPIMLAIDATDTETVYKVEFDGAVYPCTLKGADDTGWCLGNLSLNNSAAEDTGEPFVIIFQIFDTMAYAMACLVKESTADTHTIRIYTEDETDKLPEFDLAAMGLPALTMDGTTVSVYCDTTELREALEKSPVKLSFTVNMGSEIPVSGVFGAMKMMGGYQCNVVGAYGGAVMLLSIGVAEGGIQGTILTLSTG